MSASKYKFYSDPELVSMCLNGDGYAWEALIRRYRRLVYSVPIRFGFEDTDADDIFQATCVKLLEHLHEVKDDRRISAWLVTTATRQCLHLKALKTRETTSEEEDLQEPPDPSMNLEELRLQIETQQSIREAVEELGDRCKSLIGFLYFDNTSPTYEEISRQLGIPVAGVGPNRARCLDRLRLILRRRGFS